MTMNFKEGRWNTEINVTDFVKTNITSYEGDASFLVGPTERTKAVWNKCLEALAEERANNGVRSLDPSTVSTITSFAPGYIDKDNEVIVGLQTDELLRRAIKPFGGIKVVEKACRENGVEVDPKVKDIFTHYRKTHNDGVFDAYTDEIRSFRSLGFLTGLPDNYARGRIIGDYRRLALYGLDRLIEAKQKDLKALVSPMTDERIRLREEVAEQIKALKEIKIMGEQYGLDLSRPAETAQEAVQWVYMAYLAAVKEQDGAAMSLGNVSSFLDIYIEYDMAHGKLDEMHAQELIDQFVIKLRMVRHLRMQAYTDIFAGDPTWVTESIGGRFNDGRTKVTKTSFRFLQTLYNLGPSPEPNLTVLWSPQLPEGFKDFCAQVSVDTSSIQYENDDLMREVRGSDDYGIACCVSYQDIGRHIQFFGARCNLAKALLLAINGGRCENTGTVMVKDIPVLLSDELNFEEVLTNYKKVLKEMARVYNDAMNIIHYMHDKYYYEKAQMAFVDTNPVINLAYGVAGMSIAIDSLSAIKYAKVKARRNDIGLTEGFDIEGEFPCFGNDDDRVALGDPYPDFSYGMTNTFRIGKLDISFLIQGVQGVTVFNGDVYYNETHRYNRAYLENRWVSPSHPGDGKTPYGKNGYDILLTDYPLQDGSYVCLRNATVGYTFSKKDLNNKLNGLRIYLSGNNLAYIWSKDYKGIKPESRMTSGAYNTPMIDGYQRGGFPLTSTVILGIDFKF